MYYIYNITHTTSRDTTSTTTTTSGTTSGTTALVAVVGVVVGDGDTNDGIIVVTRKLKRFLSKSKGCRVVKSTTGSQCKLTRNKHGMVTQLTC